MVLFLSASEPPGAHIHVLDAQEFPKGDLLHARLLLQVPARLVEVVVDDGGEHVHQENRQQKDQHQVKHNAQDAASVEEIRWFNAPAKAHGVPKF